MRAQLAALQAQLQVIQRRLGELAELVPRDTE